MNFNKETILNCDNGELSQYEKEYLVKKYFADQDPKWKEDLGKDYEKVQFENRWRAYEGRYDYDEEGERKPFRLPHASLMKIGRIDRPERVGNRVTDFTKWIMSLYLDPPRKSVLRRGKLVERSIARSFKPLTHSDLELIYRDPLDKKPTPLKIPNLTVNGECMWGAPDLVYRKRESSEILIVERKVSNKPIPSDGWPNLRAQLWAYSQIKEFSNAERIILLGEIWGFYEGRPRLRKVHRWEHTDHLLNIESSDLFMLYGGNINA